MNAPLTHMLPVDLQRSNEYRYSKKHINGYLQTAIRENPDMERKIQASVVHLRAWLDHWLAPWTNQCKSGKHHRNKSKRLAQVSAMNLEQVVRDLFVGIAYFQQPELFVSATSQLAHCIHFDDHKDSILTVAEIVAVLSDSGAFMIWKETKETSLLIQATIPLPAELIAAIQRSVYLPPMVCEPLEIRNNYESGYLTHNDCVILGTKNGHAGDVCLDVINTQNKIALSLALDFISTVEEEPNPKKPLDSLEKYQNWMQFKNESYCIYDMLAKQGNRFWLTNKYDKRGRLYSQGYHVNPQGSSFKKASIELYHQEPVTGVPICTP